MENKLFGEIYYEYERKGQEAVNFLIKKKSGEVPNAIYHPEIGWIDLVWGIEGTKKSDGYGLSKIVKYHSSVVPELANIFKTLSVVGRTNNRFKLENEKFVCAVSRLWFENKKTWLLTFFEKKKP